MIKVCVEGVIETHIICPTGNYTTLCGIDGDDPALEQMVIFNGKPTQVNCKECIRIWKWWPNDQT